MKDFKVITVCGAGVGTSTLLRMNVEKAINKFNIPYRVIVENKSLTMSRGIVCDAVFTFESFGGDLETSYEDVIVINNLMDMNEIESKVELLLKKKNII